MLKLSFKFYPDDRAVRTPLAPGNRDKRSTAMRRTGRNNGEAKMAHIELALEMPELVDAEDYFGLGMNYSSGAGVAVDLVQAHKWFNIAAMRGHADAAQLRREIAEQLADAEIGRAQRAARDWLKSH